ANLALSSTTNLFTICSKLLAFMEAAAAAAAAAAFELYKKSMTGVARSFATIRLAMADTLLALKPSRIYRLRLNYCGSLIDDFGVIRDLFTDRSDILVRFGTSGSGTADKTTSIRVIRCSRHIVTRSSSRTLWLLCCF
ncbi:hypothetical protein U1Q18_051927, partial [Sarracenia purpurea var. burkii]